MTETAVTTTAERMAFVAELLAGLPADLPAPCVFAYSNGTVEVTWQVLHDEAETQLPTMLAVRRAIGGQWEKKPWGDRFDISQQVNDWLTVEVYAHRDVVCTRRVVGTEQFTVPAVEAQPERTETREIVEWDCHPILGDEPAAVAS